MLTADPAHRLKLFGGLVTFGFCALAGWLAFWQVDQHDRLAPMAAGSSTKPTLRASHRGSILDSRGNLLATSIPVRTVFADPSMIGTQQVAVARLLSPILDMPESDLMRCLRPIVRTNNGVLRTNSFSIVKRLVPMENWQQATQAMSRISSGVDDKYLTKGQMLALRALRTKAILSLDDELRQYPSGRLAAHVLGFVANEDRENDQGVVAEVHGLSGIESTMDDVLNGVYGWEARGERVTARSGLNVVLTLDSGIQNIVEDEILGAMARIQPESVGCIVLRPSTGQILAMANVPSYDPAAPSKSPVSHLRNRLLTDPNEPGSTFKVTVVASALDAGLVTLEDRFDCENGAFYYPPARRVLHDHHPYGILSVEEIVAKSSNIGAAKIGMKLGAQRLYQYLRDFGFGSTTKLPLPAENAGYLKNAKSWQPGTIASIPMGHEVMATPLQMALAVAAIANEGRLMRPMLVQRIDDGTGKVLRHFEPELVRQVVSPQAARTLVKAMKRVVSPEGTAAKAALEYYVAAGKTGTAEKPVNGNYKSGFYFTSFIGFFPADKPELLISVVLDGTDRKNGHMGGAVAGPIFKAIAERSANYLRIPPEVPQDAVPDLRIQKPSDLAPRTVRSTAYAARDVGAGVRMETKNARKIAD